VGLEADALWVEAVRRSTCGTCAAQKGCGHGLLNRISDGKRGYVLALPGDKGIEHYRIGDQVLLSIPEEVILRGSFVAYLLPLLGMLSGALAAVTWWPGAGDPAAIAGAVAGLLLGYGMVRWHGVRHRHDPDFQPVLLNVISPLSEQVTLS